MRVVSLGGQIFERRDDLERATRSYRAMHDLSVQAGARLTQLRGAANLARLMRNASQVKEAVDLLSPLCDEFTEGYDFPDLVEAKNLLNAIS